jgi:hypothetical protein
VVALSSLGLRRRVPTSAEKSHPFNSGAPLATILNDVVAFLIGLALLNLHRLLAYKAAQQINQRAFIFVRLRSFRHLFQPSYYSRLLAVLLGPVDAHLAKLFRALGKAPMRTLLRIYSWIGLSIASDARGRVTSCPAC